jgi:hypothetical protein
MCEVQTTDGQLAAVHDYFDGLAAHHDRLPYRGERTDECTNDNEQWAGEALAA